MIRCASPDVLWPTPGAGRSRSVSRGSGRHVDETRVVTLECDGDGVRRSIPVLGNDEIRFSGPRRFLFVHVLTVQQDDHVGILFDTARLTKIRHLRFLVGSLFGPAVELAKRDDRDLELLREELESPGELGDLLLPALDALAGAHELQVVDDDELEAVLLLEPP